ncbi:phosphatidate cytidylyltransferase [Candidatus Pelagibacter sp.]|mgnify:CR=1 FL=1|nr:phosphatidate cytidylyltransferase [Candidatus Pelagibacter sp.]
MSELKKRLSTSFILVLIFIFSMNNIYILFLSLVFCYQQLFFEFMKLLKNIIYKKSKLLLYFLCLIIMIYLSALTISIFSIFYTDNFSNKLFLIFIISTSISSDIGGYIFGKIFKGKKISKISPNKTYSGMIGSFIFSLFTAKFIFWNYIELENIFYWSILISLLTQLGDFFISFLKRKAKIKDTGNILPGHGGLLDRFDGIILSIPLGLLIFFYL